MTETRETSQRRATSYSVSGVFLASLCASGLFLFNNTPEELRVGLPIAVLSMTAISFWCLLWLREGEVPVFEIGSMFMLATAAYSIFPLITYVWSGMKYSEYSSIRLLEFSPDPSQMGVLAWEQWSYMGCFAVGYLVLRGRVPRVTATVLREAPFPTGAALVLFWCGLKFWTALLKYKFGVDYTVGYEALKEHAEGVAALPHWFNQVVGIALGLQYVFPIALFVFLLSHWRNRLARVAVVVVLTYTLLWYVFFNMGSRTWLFLPFAAAGMMYFRNVRPPKLWMIACGIAGALAAFWAFNEMRGPSTFAEKLHNLKTFVEEEDVTARYSRKDEFQVWLSSNVEVRELRNSHRLPPVPWQIYAVDVLLFTPSQLLPFDKVDPVAWFTDVETNRTGTFEYFVFSPIAQGYIGFGVPEIMFRGFLLGVAFAMIHRAYIRRAGSFFPNVIYLWLLLFCYGSLRNNSSYIFALLVLRLVPFVVVVYLLRALLGAAWRAVGEVRQARVEAYPSLLGRRNTRSSSG